MVEHTPWADRFSTEVDAFFRLWKNRRLLAVIFLLIVVGVGVVSTIGWFRRGSQIETLKSENRELKRDLDKTRNELIPIKQLYPKLELSAAVAKLIESHNQLKAEINLAKQKEIQKRFVPFSQSRVAEFIEEARNFVNRHSDINFEVNVLSVNPSNDLFRKCTELTNLFRSASIKAKYSNTMFSSKYNVVIKCSEALPRDVINEIKQLLKIVFKNTLYFEFLKPGGKDRDGSILIYFLGSPSFDNDGCVFYENPIF